MNNEKYINLISETKLVGDWTVPVKDILISKMKEHKKIEKTFWMIKKQKI